MVEGLKFNISEVMIFLQLPHNGYRRLFPLSEAGRVVDYSPPASAEKKKT
jgi:hypothetical protein